jgi:hypothetical protein
MRPDPAAHLRGLLAASEWNDPLIDERLAGFGS